MASVYLRTLKEAMEDGLVCIDPCEHIDCAEWRDNTVAKCQRCGERAAGEACFIEDGGWVHARCVFA